MARSDLVFFFSLAASPATVPTPETFGGRAEVVTSERWGGWEKSLVVTLPRPTRILSTNEGFLEAELVVNHGAQPSVWTRAFEELSEGSVSGGDAYLAEVEARLADARGVDASRIAVTGTAVDLDHLAVVTERGGPFVVTALVTAGARTNAHRAGTDEGRHIEAAGTVNILVTLNARLADAAMLNVVMLATEAKAAAMQDLQVPSSYTPAAVATGTGTDSVIVIPAGEGPWVPYAGGHAKVGELVAKATHRAVLEALVAQGGYARPSLPQQ